MKKRICKRGVSKTTGKCLKHPRKRTGLRGASLHCETYKVHHGRKADRCRKVCLTERGGMVVSNTRMPLTACK